MVLGEYDVAVIGGGHAGCEAALAAARLGMKTVMFSISLDAIGNLPCNPSIGGTAKGHRQSEEQQKDISSVRLTHSAVKWVKRRTLRLYSQKCLIKAKVLPYIHLEHRLTEKSITLK